MDDQRQKQIQGHIWVNVKHTHSLILTHTHTDHRVRVWSPNCHLRCAGLGCSPHLWDLVVLHNTSGQAQLPVVKKPSRFTLLYKLHSCSSKKISHLRNASTRNTLFTTASWLLQLIGFFEWNSFNVSHDWLSQQNLKMLHWEESSV